MTAILCDIHGTTIAAMVSSDIKEDFLKNNGPSQEYYPVRVIIFDEVTPVNYCWISSGLANQLHISVDKILSFDEYSNYDDSLHLEPVCGECFQAWINK